MDHLFFAITHTSYKLLNMVRFCGPPTVVLHNTNIKLIVDQINFTATLCVHLCVSAMELSQLRSDMILELYVEVELTIYVVVGRCI